MLSGVARPVVAVVTVLGLTVACQTEREPQDLAQVLQDAVARQPASFTTPDTARRDAIADAVEALLTTAPTAVPRGYDRVRLRGAGGPLIGLAEVGSPRRGDGLYVVRIGRRAPLVIEAPHPVSDQSSELVAAAVFADTRAEALIVAGTRRDAAPDGSADAAHAETTAFAAVDQRLSVPGVTVVQIHGFATAKHPGYPQVVLSDSTPAPGRWLTALAQALQRAGFSTCVFDGSVCRELGATHNVEAAHAQASGARFVHVELADGTRQSFDARRRVSAALAHALQDILAPRPGLASG
jgi:hypothetical protein